MKKGEEKEIAYTVIQIILLVAMIETLLNFGPIGFALIVPMALMERFINKCVYEQQIS